MKSMAMYVGVREYERKERVLEDGTRIEAASGVQYLFYCSDWNGEEIEDMGRTRFQTVLNDDTEIKGLPPLGGLCEVQIRENFGNRADNACTFLKAL